MKPRVLTDATRRELDRREFLKAAGAATALGVASAFGGGLLSGCAPAKAPERKAPAGYEMITIVGSSIGSGASTIALVFAATLNKHYPEIEWGSRSGVVALTIAEILKGTLKVGLCTVENYVELYGLDKVPQSRFRSLVNGSPVNRLFVVPKDKPWTDITQVPRGANLSPGSPGTPLPIACEAWLNLCGLSKKDFNWLPLGKSELADAWQAGKLDVAFISCSGPEGWMVATQRGNRPMKPLGLSPEQTAKAMSERTFEKLGFLPPETTALNDVAPGLFPFEVVGPKSINSYACRDDFPEEIAYKTAKVFDEHLKDMGEMYYSIRLLTPQYFAKYHRPPYEMHPGVAKYYREKGYLK